MIPSDWKETNFTDLVDLKMGYAFKSKDFVDCGVPLVRMSNLYQNKLDLKRSSVYLPKDYIEKYSQFRISPDDILLSMTGTLGKEDYAFAVLVPPGTETMLLNQRVARVRSKSPDDKEFILSLMRSRLFLNQVYSKPGGTKQANISTKDLSEIMVPCPPPSERSHIGEIINLWSDTIGVVERLIMAKNRLAKSLMQKLLFDRADDSLKISEIATVTMGLSPSSSNYNEDKRGMPLIQGNADISEDRRTISRVFTTQTTKVVEKGDIIISVRAPVGEVALADNDACIGRGVAGLKVHDKFDLNYIFYSLMSLESKWKKYSQGSTFEAVNSKDLKDFVIPVVSDRNYQKKLGDFFDNAHYEILLLKRYRKCLVKQKQGLMQQLLTGKKRIR